MNSPYAQCNILVTGGAGFIGSHLVESLVSQGAYVTVLDNFKTGKKENLNTVLSSIALIEGDITDYETCRKATAHQQLIFHCAAETSVPESMHNPLVCYDTNLTGTAIVLEAARQNKVQRLIFSSSCAVYGPQQGPCTETAPCHPTSPYGLSKLMGEMLCKNYSTNNWLETVSLRYFNVYGTRQDAYAPYAAAVANFKAAMAQNRPITIFGDGLQTRDFVPVQQIVDANLNVGILPEKSINGLIFNCATGTSITLLQLVQKLKHEFPNFTESIMFAPARDGDVKHTAADCSRYKKLMQDYQDYYTIPAYQPEQVSNSANML